MNLLSLLSEDFLLFLCLHVHSRNVLLNITKYTSSMGIIMNFGYSLIFLVAPTSRVKVPSKAPYSTGLLGTSSKTSIFSCIITVNRIKPPGARSDQWLCHLSLPRDQKLHLLPQAHHNFEINLMSFVLQSLIFRKNEALF